MSYAISSMMPSTCIYDVFLMGYHMFPGSITAARGRLAAECSPIPVRLQRGSNHRIKQKQSLSLHLTVLFGFKIKLQWLKNPYLAPQNHPHHSHTPPPPRPEQLCHWTIIPCGQAAGGARGPGRRPIVTKSFTNALEIHIQWLNLMLGVRKSSEFVVSLWNC